MSTEKLREFMETAKQAKIELGKIARTSLAGLFQEFLDKWPQVNAVRFRAYTPYFNDGDACTFGVRSLELAVAGQEDEFEEPYFGELYDWARENGEVVKTWKPSADPVAVAFAKEYEAINDMLQNDSLEDGIKLAFGEHVEVIFRRGADAFEVDTYEHE